MKLLSSTEVPAKPSNAPELFAKEDVDGGLIGGAALKAADFLAIGKGFPQK